MAGRWWPVTGTRDAGESPARCALRELHEETALSPITLYRTNLTFPVEGGGHLRIFVAAVETGATVTLNWEHDDYRWCYPQEVADLAGDFVTPIMQEAIRIVEAQPSNLKVAGE